VVGIRRIIMIRKTEAVSGLEPTRIRLKAVFLAADLNGIISLNGHDGSSFLPIPWLESWAVRGDKLMIRGKP